MMCIGWGGELDESQAHYHLHKAVDVNLENASFDWNIFQDVANLFSIGMPQF